MDILVTFNEAAFKYSEDKAGAYGLLGDKAQHADRDPDFWAAAARKEGVGKSEPVKLQCGLAPDHGALGLPFASKGALVAAGRARARSGASW